MAHRSDHRRRSSGHFLGAILEDVRLGTFIRNTPALLQQRVRFLSAKPAPTLREYLIQAALLLVVEFPIAYVGAKIP